MRSLADGIIVGASAAAVLLVRILPREAQGDRRWILAVLVAVVIAALAGIVVGWLLKAI